VSSLAPLPQRRRAEGPAKLPGCYRAGSHRVCVGSIWP